MTRILDRLPSGSRVLLIRLRSLGDCVLTTPAIALLKTHRPDLEVGVIVEQRFQAVYEGNPRISRILPPEFAAVRSFRPDLCLNLHGGTRSAWWTLFSGARFRAGFGHYRGQWAYNVRIPRAQQVLQIDRMVHTAEHVASAMFYLGVPEQPIPRAELFAPAGSDELLKTPYAVIHAFASQSDKTWPASRFVELAQWLRLEQKLRAVFLGSPSDDLSRFHDFDTFVRPLSETKRLLYGASLFVGNDSGPAHMAAAFGLPVVTLFGSSDERIWGPWRTASAVIRNPNGPIEGIPVDQVAESIARLRVLA